MKIVKKYLGNISNNNVSISKLKIGLPLDKTDIDDILIVLAFVYHIKDDPMFKISNDTVTYKKVMNIVFDLIVNYVNEYVNRYNRGISLGVLVTNVTKNTVYVNRNQYDLFLKKEGVASLLGMLLSGVSNKDRHDEFSLHNCLLNAGKYEDLWERAVKREKAATLHSVCANYNYIYNLIIHETLDIMSNEAKDLSTYDKKEVTLKIKNYIDTLSTVETMDIKTTSLYILGKIIFPNTNLYKFVSTMRMYSDNDKNLSADEAATLSSVDIIIDYLIDQVETGSNNDLI